MMKDKSNRTAPQLTLSSNYHTGAPAPRHRHQMRSHDENRVTSDDHSMEAKEKEGENLLLNDASKYRSMKTRVTSSIWMIGGFVLIVYMGHVYMWAMIVVIQILMAKELFTLARLSTDEKEQLSVGAQWYLWLWNWLLFITAMLSVYGRLLSKQLEKTISSDKMLILFFSGVLKYDMMICYALYISGFVWFTLQLEQEMGKYQLGQYAWTHMIVFFTCTLCSFSANIFEGLIWFLLPASLTIINDIAAYFFGFYFGRTPLIKLSPRKTWEGFSGAFFTTLLSAFVVAYLMGSFELLTCPRKDLSTSWLHCDPGPMFKPNVHSLDWLPSWVPWREVTTMPVQSHAMFLGLFASIIGPFGGHFASGLKRSFNVKDFGDSIPGHGGITDRIDCQVVMATFSYIYYQSFIATPN